MRMLLLAVFAALLLVPGISVAASSDDASLSLDHQIRKYESYITRRAHAVELLKKRHQEAELFQERLEPYLDDLAQRLTLAVRADLAFLNEEREQRLTALASVLGNYDAPLGEKLRRTLEALQVEAQYGSEITAEDGVIATPEGAVQGRDLRVGRVADYFLSRDAKRAWIRERSGAGGESGKGQGEEQGWRALDQSEAEALAQALAMLDRSEPAGLVVLPVATIPEHDPASAPAQSATLFDDSAMAALPNSPLREGEDTAAFLSGEIPREKRLAALKARFEALAQEEQAAQAALADQEQDLTLLESAARGAARDAERLLLRSLGGALHPERLAACRALLDAEGLPRLAQIQNLAEALLAQMRDSGKVQRLEAPVLDRDGNEVRTAVLRVGENTAYTRTAYGFAGLTVLEGGRLSVSAAELPGEAEPSVAKALHGPGGTPQALLPLDFSSGGWFAADSSKNSFRERIASGGFLVWPILLAGLAGLLIGLERFVVLMRVNRTSPETLHRLEELLRAGRTGECGALCAATNNSPACRVLHAGLNYAGAPRDVLDNVFHDAILKEVPRLERFLPTLSVLGATAPLLGLLGTVTGMINTFTAMTLFGNTDPKLMSGGISEALVTTQLGLSVAIPILLLHHFLERRVDGIVSDMEEKSVAFSVTLLGKGGGA
ncbi:MAG: DUF3450 family protein [Desulfovibrio sp.]